MISSYLYFIALKSLSNKLTSCLSTNFCCGVLTLMITFTFGAISFNFCWSNFTGTLDITLGSSSISLGESIDRGLDSDRRSISTLMFWKSTSFISSWLYLKLRKLGLTWTDSVSSCLKSLSVTIDRDFISLNMLGLSLRTTSSSFNFYSNWVHRSETYVLIALAHVDNDLCDIIYFVR